MLNDCIKVFTASTDNITWSFDRPDNQMLLYISGHNTLRIARFSNDAMTPTDEVSGPTFDLIARLFHDAGLQRNGMKQRETKCFIEEHRTPFGPKIEPTVMKSWVRYLNHQATSHYEHKKFFFSMNARTSCSVYGSNKLDIWPSCSMYLSNCNEIDWATKR